MGRLYGSKTQYVNSDIPLYLLRKAPLFPHSPRIELYGPHSKLQRRFLYIKPTESALS